MTPYSLDEATRDLTLFAFLMLALGAAVAGVYALVGGGLG